MITLEQAITLGGVIAKSGYFPDARDSAQATVKILAGQELGIGPIAAMSGISIVKGRPCLGANLMAALVRRSEAYDYHIERLDNQGCELVFFKGGKEAGRSSFTSEDAKRAGLSGDTWTKYARNMLFARAMSNGVRWYCPDAFSGQTVYDPSELMDDTGDIAEEETPPSAPPTKDTAVPGPKKATAALKMSEAMHRAIEALITKNGLDRINLHKYLVEIGWIDITPTGPHLTDLSPTHGSYILGNWEKMVSALKKWEEKEAEGREADAREQQDLPWDAAEGGKECSG